MSFFSRLKPQMAKRRPNIESRGSYTPWKESIWKKKFNFLGQKSISKKNFSEFRKNPRGYHTKKKSIEDCPIIFQIFFFEIFQKFFLLDFINKFFIFGISLIKFENFGFYWRFPKIFFLVKNFFQKSEKFWL